MEAEKVSSSSHKIKFIDSYGYNENKLLVVDSYIFQHNKTVNESSYFKCNHNNKGCAARVIVYELNKEKCTFASIKVQPTPHNHLPNPEKIVRHEVNTDARNIVKENIHLKTSRVLEELSNRFVPTPEDSPCMGKSSSTKRRVRYARRKFNGEKRMGTCREDFILTKELLLTKPRQPEEDGEQFLLTDMPGINRTLVYATKPMLETLAKDCTIWLLDGTFKLSPHWFSQVFTVHALYMDICVPFAYSLLPGKKASDYKNVLESVTSHRVPGGFIPEYIISDFELGIIKACREMFPHVNLHGCLFHLSQSIYRKVQACGYTETYTEDKIFRNSVRSLSALAFVPPGDVFGRFMEIKSFYGHKADSREIIDYFNANYIGDTWEVTTFPIPFWNCYDRFIYKVPRTNNAVEGWHYKINSTLNGCHPSLWSCIESLQIEQMFWEEEIVRIRTGLCDGQKKKYRVLDERLGRIVRHYNSALDTIQYLIAISTCMYDYLD